jgi:hypothetical protein
LILRKRGGKGVRSLTFLGKRSLDLSSLAFRKYKELGIYNRQRIRRRSKRRAYKLRERLNKLLRSSKRRRRKPNVLYHERIVVQEKKARQVAKV